MTFIRENLPDPETYFTNLGHKITGKGKRFRTTCGIHNGDGLNLSVLRGSGAFNCFACGAHGGDVLAYEMQRTGADFVTSAKALGAWRDDGKTDPHQKPSPLTPRQALEILQFETMLVCIELTRYAKGEIPNEHDAERVRIAAGRIWNVQRIFQNE